MTAPRARLRPRRARLLAIVAGLVALGVGGCGPDRPELGAGRDDFPSVGTRMDDERVGLPETPGDGETTGVLDRIGADPCAALTDALRASAGVTAPPVRHGDDTCRAGDGDRHVEVRVEPVQGSWQAHATAFQEERPGEQWPVDGVPGLPLSHVHGSRVEVACFFPDFVVRFTLPAAVLTHLPPNAEGSPVFADAVITALGEALGSPS